MKNAPSLLRQITLLGAIALCPMILSGCGPAEPITEAKLPDIRRLTEEQYRNIITDVLGDSIIVGGRFDSPVRKEGLLAVGTRNSTVTGPALAQYDALARSISKQVTSEPTRNFLVPCAKEGQSTFDEVCATQFISTVGRLLFRRPMTEEELASRVTIIHQTTQRLDDFTEGIATGLASLLVAPQFLFIAETAEEDPARPGHHRLDAFSKAARLSFFLWNRSPDDILLQAAELGEIHVKEKLAHQVVRMMESPLLKSGVRAFFSDLLHFSEFDFVEKDSLIYPAFTAATVRDAREQTLRTIIDHIVTKDADYRDLFTTRDTFMTASLGLVYRLPVKAKTGTWEPYQFTDDDQRIGIQDQIGFLALNSHPGRSSPTLRGKAIRNMLLCQQVPDPPPDVDFSGFNDPNSPSDTARERLTAHSTNAACAGCHRITDPIGLALENFDGAGQFRQTENGATIDPSGELDGVSYSDNMGLGFALHKNPATTKCIVNRIYAYASGHTLSSQNSWMSYLEERFVAERYRVKSLLETISTSNTFYAVTKPDTSKQTIETAANITTIE